MTIYNLAYANGNPINVHADGNNAAFICWGCGHPVLALPPRKEDGKLAGGKPKEAICIRCGKTYSLYEWAPKEPAI